MFYMQMFDIFTKFWKRSYTLQYLNLRKKCCSIIRTVSILRFKSYKDKYMYLDFLDK